MQGQNLDMFVDALLLNPSLHVLRSGSEDARTALHQVGSAHFAFDSGITENIIVIEIQYK